MSLTTKQGILDEITARKDAMPSGVSFPDGTSPSGVASPKAIYGEVLDLADAILALSSGSGPQNTVRDEIRTEIAGLRLGKTSGAYVDGVQQKRPAPPRGMAANLVTNVLQPTVRLIDAIYTATDAADAAAALGENYVDGAAGADASVPRGSSVYVEGTEQAGRLALKTFRQDALAALELTATALP